MQSSVDLLPKKYRLGGPQLDRDMKWIMNDSETIQPQQREDLQIDRNAEKKVIDLSLISIQGCDSILGVGI